MRLSCQRLPLFTIHGISTYQLAFPWWEDPSATPKIATARGRRFGHCSLLRSSSAEPAEVPSTKNTGLGTVYHNRCHDNEYEVQYIFCPCWVVVEVRWKIGPGKEHGMGRMRRKPSCLERSYSALYPIATQLSVLGSKRHVFWTFSRQVCRPREDREFV